MYKYGHNVDYICTCKLTRVGYWSRWWSINSHGIIRQILPTKLCYQVQELWSVCAKLGICLHAEMSPKKRSLSVLWRTSVIDQRCFGASFSLIDNFLAQTCHSLTVLRQKSITHWQSFAQVCHSLTIFWHKPVSDLAEVCHSLAMLCTDLSLIDSALAKFCHLCTNKSCKGTVWQQPPAAQPMALHAIPQGCVCCVSELQLKLCDITAVQAVLAACHKMHHFVMTNEPALFCYFYCVIIIINEPAWANRHDLVHGSSSGWMSDLRQQALPDLRKEKTTPFGVI